MTSDEQLEEWLKGNPLHNHEIGECCPDFSCCKRELLADEEMRRLFCEAERLGNDTARTAMLMSFLGKALAALDVDEKVYVAGQQDLPQA